MSAVGVIAPVTDAATVRAAGADYIEPTIVGNVVTADETGTWGPNPEYRDGPAPSFAILFPGSLRLSDPEFPAAEVTDYLASTLAAVAAVARPGALIVLGSGAARTIPDGVDVTAARARFAQVVAEARDEARAHGLRIVLEPLHQGETNLLNTVAEAAAFLDEHGIEGVPLVADLFHIVLEDEPIDVVASHVDRIAHVHVADTGRRAPGTGDWPIGELLTALRGRGYRGNVTIECHWDDLAAELPAALAHVRAADPGA